MNDHWIPVAIYSDFLGREVGKAIDAAYKVHLWTLERLSSRYRQHIFTADIADFKKELTIYSRQEKLYRDAQRFTLDQAMLRTIAWFREEDKYRSWKEKFPPDPIPRKEYTEIEIEPREIWKDYIERYGQISTVFGMLTLEGDWQKILHRQARQMKIAPKELPKHWKSLTIKQEDGGYKIRFNAR